MGRENLRETKAVSTDLHNVGLAVIEVGRQILHAPAPSWEVWAERIEAEVVKLRVLVAQMKDHGRV